MDTPSFRRLRAGLGSTRGTALKVDPGLTRLIAEAQAARNELFSRIDDSIEAMTERLGTSKGKLTALVRLSYMAPDLVQEIIAGRQPVELTPTWLLRWSKDLPHDWVEQRRFLGFPD